MENIPIMDNMHFSYGSYFVPLNMIDEPYRSEIQKNIENEDCEVKTYES